MERITWLQHVEVHDVRLTPDQWTQLFSMLAANRSLSFLRLAGAEVPAGAFEMARDLPELEHLYLINPRMTDADLQAIGEMTSLKLFGVENIPLSDAVIDSWMNVSNMTDFKLRGCATSPEAEQRLRQRCPEVVIQFD